MTENKFVRSINEVMTLQEFINEYYDGNQAKFARFAQKEAQHINRQLRCDSYYVVNGTVVQIKYESNCVDREKRRR